MTSSKPPGSVTAQSASPAGRQNGAEHSTAVASRQSELETLEMLLGSVSRMILGFVALQRVLLLSKKNTKQKLDIQCNKINFMKLYIIRTEGCV